MSANKSVHSISVVVPVYKSASTLRLLTQRLKPVLKELGVAYEAILVDDGSGDDTWNTISTLSCEEPWLKGIRLMRNYGQHNALLCGIRAARHEVIVTIDDDLQNPPEEIAGLLSKLVEGYDVVYGTPVQETHGFLRDMASVITKIAMQNAMGTETARLVSAFRAFRSHLRGGFASYQSPFVSIDVLLTWATTCFASVKVQHDPRKTGKSNYTFRNLVRHAINMMTGFSVLPLQIASVFGFSFTLFGMAALAYVLGRYLIQGSSVPGFPFLASMIAIFSGAQLFALGIIGEYLARMHFRIIERPAYAVAATVNFQPTVG
jgi:undecaprenyl-phosphate 4-deoxy-4-formamido-L-arabinose transferase